MGWQAGILLALILASPWLGAWSEAPGRVYLAGGACALALASASLRAPRGLSRTLRVTLLGGGTVVWLSYVGLSPLDSARNAAAIVLAGIACFGVTATAVRGVDREPVLIGVGVAGAVFAAAMLLCAAAGWHGLAWLDLARAARWLSIPCALGLAGLLACAPRGRKSGWSVLWFCVVSSCGAAIASCGTADTGLALGIAALGLMTLCLRGRRRTGARARHPHSIAVWGARATLFCVGGHLLTSPPFDEPGLVLAAAAITGLAYPAPSRRFASGTALWADAARSNLALVSPLRLSAMGLRGQPAAGPAEPRLTAGVGVEQERQRSLPRSARGA